MKLRVLAGAKQGTEIPLKKSKFVIGRASDCTLRAGSEAISRHHCVVLRSEEGASVRDLGSRNGTYVNDEKIRGETPLKHGDRLRIGPLEFEFEGAVDLSREKRPPVKNVAEVVGRSANPGTQTVEEDDISSWLLSSAAPDQPISDTRSFRVDETQAAPSLKPQPAAEAEASADSETLDETESESQEAAAGPKGKKTPGKLPKLPPKPMSKDSREAAADILRNMARRR